MGGGGEVPLILPFLRVLEVLAGPILPVVPLLVELFELEEEAMGGREFDEDIVEVLVSKILCL